MSLANNPDAQKQAAAGFLGSVALCYYWKEHRVWGFIIGGLIGYKLYVLIAPSSGDGTLLGSIGGSLGPLQGNT